MLTLPSTLEKASPLSFQLNKVAVLAAATDAYWMNSANIKSVIVVYRSTAGNQRKRLEFDFTQATPTATATWTGTARSDHDIEQIILVDFDGDTYTIPSANLPSGKGVSFGGGAPIVTPVVHNYSPNGAINDMVTDGTNVYIGGAFTALGFGATNAATLNASTGENIVKDQLSGKMPVFNGTIRTVLNDGEDTIFVGGDFTTMDGVTRNRIAKLKLVNGSWVSDATFNAASARVGFNGQVLNIISDGSHLFVSGWFTSYTDQNNVANVRYQIAKIDKTNGAVASFFAGGVNSSTGSFRISAMAIDGDYIIFSGNTPTSSSGSANSYTGGRITKLHKDTASLFPNWPSNSIPSGFIETIKVLGDSIYVGGSFGTFTISGVVQAARSLVIKMSKDTLAVDNSFSVGWSSVSSSTVFDIQPDGSGNILLGGKFYDTAGTSLRKVNASTGASVQAFNAGTSLRNGFAIANTGAAYVNRIIVSGSSVYACGKFSGQSLHSDPVTNWSVAKLDLSTGALDTSFSTGNALLSYDGSFPEKNVVFGFNLLGSNLHIFGWFESWGGYSRQGVAKLAKDSDGNWKVVEAFNTASGGTTVNTLALSGSDLYVGGTFTTWAGSARNRVAKLNATTGALDPSFGVGVFTSGQTTGQFNGVTNTVNKMLVDGSDVVIAGAFTTYSKKSSASGTTTPATPNWIRVNVATNTEAVPANGGNQIYSMVLDGSDLIIGGNFSSWGGNTAKRYLVRCDKSTGVTSWAFNNNDQLWTSPAPSVYILSIIDGKLFVGAFATITGTSEAGTFVVNKDTGAFLKKYATSVFGGNASPHAPTSGSFMSDSTYVYVATGRTSYGVFFRRFNKSTLDIDSTWGFTNTAANSTVIRCAVLVGTEILTSIEGSQVTQMQPQEKRLYSIKASDATQNKII